MTDQRISHEVATELDAHALDQAARALAAMSWEGALDWDSLSESSRYNFTERARTVVTVYGASPGGSVPPGQRHRIGTGQAATLGFEPPPPGDMESEHPEFTDA